MICFQQARKQALFVLCINSADLYTVHNSACSLILVVAIFATQLNTSDDYAAPQQQKILCCMACDAFILPPAQCVPVCLPRECHRDLQLSVGHHRCPHTLRAGDAHWGVQPTTCISRHAYVGLVTSESEGCNARPANQHSYANW